MMYSIIAQRDRKAIIGAGSSSDFIHYYKTILRCIIQNICSFIHLYKNVDSPLEILSEAPIRVKILSTIERFDSLQGYMNQPVPLIE